MWNEFRKTGPNASANHLQVLLRVLIPDFAERGFLPQRLVKNALVIPKLVVPGASHAFPLPTRWKSYSTPAEKDDQELGRLVRFYAYSGAASSLLSRRTLFAASRAAASLRAFVAMLAKIYSAAVYGIDAYEVEIEVNAGRSDPKIIIVGLPYTAVKESQDRVTTAIANSGYFWPRGRTTINLAPPTSKRKVRASTCQSPSGW